MCHLPECDSLQLGVSNTGVGLRCGSAVLQQPTLALQPLGGVSGKGHVAPLVLGTRSVASIVHICALEAKRANGLCLICLMEGIWGIRGIWGGQIVCRCGIVPCDAHMSLRAGAFKHCQSTDCGRFGGCFDQSAEGLYGRLRTKKHKRVSFHGNLLQMQFFTQADFMCQRCLLVDNLLQFSALFFPQFSCITPPKIPLWWVANEGLGPARRSWRTY